MRTRNNANEYLTKHINGGTAVNFTSSDNGNLTDVPAVGGEPGWEYAYDAENRLVSGTRSDRS